MHTHIYMYTQTDRQTHIPRAWGRTGRIKLKHSYQKRELTTIINEYVLQAHPSHLRCLLAAREVDNQCGLPYPADRPAMTPSQRASSYM